MIRIRMPVLLTLLLALSAPGFAAPTAEEAIAAARADLQKSGSPIGVGNPREKSALPPSPSEIAMQDTRTRASYLISMQHFYQYRTDGYAFRSRVFEWQLLSSRVIFVIVVLLVLAGIYFAAIQFHVALAAAKPHQKAVAPGSTLSLATQLEISAKGLVINSSILGLLVLSVSLAFFYLYLVYVYPINDTL